jgi:hypothetical protein
VLELFQIAADMNAPPLSHLHKIDSIAANFFKNANVGRGDEGLDL